MPARFITLDVQDALPPMSKGERNHLRMGFDLFLYVLIYA